MKQDDLINTLFHRMDHGIEEGKLFLLDDGLGNPPIFK